jgi:uncharacterized protein (TIGR03437 family)
MKPAIPFAMIFLAAGLRAQTGCLAIQFQEVAQQTTWDASSLTASGLLRQADGSFTEETYNINLNQPAKTGSVADFQQNFFNCVGLAARTRTPGPPKLGKDPLGSSGTNPITVDLAGTGVPFVAGIWQNFAPNALVVGHLNSDLSVKGTTRYAVGPNPIAVVAGDFNGDGKHDIAVVYSGPDDGSAPGGVSILLGNGDGTLQPAVNYTTGLYAGGIVAWDFNGDGRTDLAVTNSGAANLVILFGSANGTLTPGATYSLPQASAYIGRPVVADINGDGIPDLVVSTSAGVSVLYGAAGGTFKPPTPLIVTSASLAFVAAGDFNKDGKIDIALTDGNAGDVFIYLNQGNGTFSAPVGYSIGYEPDAFWVEDFDGDGNLDLVFAAGHPDALTPEQYSEVIDVLFGNGDGTFVGAATYPVVGDAGAVAVAADFNGDGIPDIATATSILFGKGNGAFATPTPLPLGAGGTTISPLFIAEGDVNGDGKPDLVVTDQSGFIYVLLNNGNGTFASPVGTSSSSPGAAAIVLGDFNNDKKLDIAVTIPGSNNISILLGNGDGTFQAPKNIPVGSNPTALAAADLNGDGNLDLAVVNSGTAFNASDPGGLTILLGNGSGGFQASSYTAGFNPGSVSVGDFNGDGKPDLVVTAEAPDFNTTFNYDLVTFLGNGNGTFQPGVLVPTDFGPTQAMVADFSGSGKQDLIVLHCCGDTDFTFLLGRGDGTFQPEVSFVSGSAGAGAVADLNGDGKPDLVVANGQNPSALSISVLLNVTSAASANTPVITPGGVVTAGAFGAFSAAAPGSWVEIYGSNLASITRSWTAADFNGNSAPTSLSGVKVTIGDQSAFIDYISPGQVNAQLPSGIGPGSLPLTVTSGNSTSAPVNITVNATEPGLLAPPQFKIGANQYVVAQLSDGTYVLPTGAIAGVSSRPAKPGETVVIYGVGFGSVVPNIPAGQIVIAANQLSATLQFLFGQTPAQQVPYAGLAPAYVGLYQFNIVVPQVPDNDLVPLTFNLGGALGTQTLYTAVHQ